MITFLEYFILQEAPVGNTYTDAEWRTKGLDSRPAAGAGPTLVPPGEGENNREGPISTAERLQMQLDEIAGMDIRSQGPGLIQFKMELDRAIKGTRNDPTDVNGFKRRAIMNVRLNALKIGRAAATANRGSHIGDQLKQAYEHKKYKGRKLIKDKKKHRY